MGGGAVSRGGVTAPGDRLLPCSALPHPGHALRAHFSIAHPGPAFVAFSSMSVYCEE